MPRRDADLAEWILEQLKEDEARPVTLDELFAAEVARDAPPARPAPRRPRARAAVPLTCEVRVPRHLWSRAHDRLTRSRVPFSTLATDDPRAVTVSTTPDGADVLASFGGVTP